MLEKTSERIDNAQIFLLLLLKLITEGGALVCRDRSSNDTRLDYAV